MKRRLYFLLPDNAHAAALVRDLEMGGIARAHMHAIAGRGGDVSSLPVASSMQRNDTGARIERYLWSGHLAVFFLALIALVALALLPVPAGWLLLPAAVMLACFVSGLEFVVRTPNVHLDEFRSALRHREILLMIDVPVGLVADVENLAHRRHPEAMAGGVGWSIETLPV
jgi:hypothetical protein